MKKCSTENPLSNLSDVQIYWKLFFTTLILSASTFGGGFVIIGMMKQKFVSQLQWLQDEEMLDMTAIAQSSPGALGVNIAIVVGYRIKKFWGAVVCTLGAVAGYDGHRTVFAGSAWGKHCDCGWLSD